MRETSRRLYERANKTIPGGVNSPVRAFGSVGGHPVVIASAEGARVTDVDGNQYIDFVGSWGPMILGHNHPDVRNAVIEACERGLSYGAPTEIELQLAEKVCTRVPSVEQVRMVNSGTEATMSAIRLARGATGRNKIIKFDGCYHGHSDCLLVSGGSGLQTFNTPSSAGVPEAVTADTLVARFNDMDHVNEFFASHPDEIAAVILEPIAGNMNLIPPEKDFLQSLREACSKHGALLIIDEVMTGFRVHEGGAQALYDVPADISCFGKIIGGGMPVGAFGASREIMKHLSPTGPVYQAGTLSGNPIAMTAGLKTLELTEKPDFYTALKSYTDAWTLGVNALMKAAEIPFFARSVCGMFGFFFSETSEIHHLDDVKRCDIERFKQFFHAALDEGVYLAPSAFEAGFISAAHTPSVLEEALSKIENAIEKIS